MTTLFMDNARRTVRSYVIRVGRITSGQRRALEQYWPLYGLELEDGPLNVVETYGNTNPVVLEIGFGMGDSLAETAARHPGTNYLGVEVHRPGIGRLLQIANEKSIANLRVYCGDAIDVLEHCINPASVARIQIFFPDPWPKKRHHKRRLIDTAFAKLIADRLMSGSILHIATDWRPYAEEIVEVMARCRGLKEVAPPARPLTKFERRARRLGHEVIELAFEKRTR